MRSDSKERSKIPGVFNAAGLMVPEPSIMFPPRPFIDVVTTGCDAEYMADPSGGIMGWALAEAPGGGNRRTEWCWMRESARREQVEEAGGEAVSVVWEEGF